MTQKEDYQERLLAYAKRQPNGDKPDVRIQLERCKLCGKLDWISSEVLKQGAGFFFGVTESFEPCGFCRDVHQRSPELVAWILAVIANRDRKADEEPA